MARFWILQYGDLEVRRSEIARVLKLHRSNVYLALGRAEKLSRRQSLQYSGPTTLAQGSIELSKSTKDRGFYSHTTTKRLTLL